MNLASSELSTQNILNQLEESGQKTLGLLSHTSIIFTRSNSSYILSDSITNSAAVQIAKCQIENGFSCYIIFIAMQPSNVYPFIKDYYTLDEVTLDICGEWSCEILNMITGDLIGHFANTKSIKFNGEIPILIEAPLNIKGLNQNNLIGSFGLINDNIFRLEIYKF